MTDHALTVGSLFSGIGGLELGLEQAGMRVVWQVEKDDYCRRVLAKHWPDVERFEDVRDVGAHNLKPVDLICGGFPCQDISYAGKGAGLSGERSGLWHEFARIIRELEPRLVLVENVSALLSRGLDAVLGTLASLGYDAEWDCVSASDVGAPHQRERTFVVAYTAVDHVARRGYSGADKRHPERDATFPLWCSNDVADADSGSAQGIIASGNDAQDGEVTRERSAGYGRRAGLDSEWPAEPAVGRVAHGIPERVDRIKALGNAVVPQVAEYIGRLIVEADKAIEAA